MEAAIRSVLSKYATFQGRAKRAEFWWWILALLVVLAITRIIDAQLIVPALGLDPMAMGRASHPLSFIAALLLLIPTLAVEVRRLHDIGRTGWWLLINVIPVVGALVLLYFFVQKSAPGPNSYG